MKEPGQYSDIEIIQRILNGEPALFEILIRRNNPFLYKAGRCYGFNHEDVQDLMQDSFTDAYINLSKFENRSSFKTWLLRIMLNNCFRKKQKLSFKNEVMNEINDSSIQMFSSRKSVDTNNADMIRELKSVMQ